MRTRILTVRSSPRSIDRENGRVIPFRTNDQQQEGKDRTRRKSFLFHRFFPVHEFSHLRTYRIYLSPIRFAPITAQSATPKTMFYFGMNERFPDESRNDEDRDAITTREFHAVGIFKHSDRDRDRGDGKTSMDGILDDADEDNVSCSSVIFRFDSIDGFPSFSGEKRRGEYFVEVAANSAEKAVRNPAILTIRCLEITLYVGNSGSEYEHCQRRNAGLKPPSSLYLSIYLFIYLFIYYRVVREIISFFHTSVTSQTFIQPTSF